MTRVKVPDYILKQKAESTCLIQDLPYDVFKIILKHLAKFDKISLLLTCRGFLKNLRPQKIERPRGWKNIRLLVLQIGSGGNIKDWAFCNHCSVLRSTIPQKWEGGQAEGRLPLTHRNKNLSVAVRMEYHRLCFDWVNIGRTQMKTRPGVNHEAQRCPNCYLKQY